MELARLYYANGFIVVTGHALASTDLVRGFMSKLSAIPKTPAQGVALDLLLLDQLLALLTGVWINNRCDAGT